MKKSFNGSSKYASYIRSTFGKLILAPLFGQQNIIQLHMSATMDVFGHHALLSHLMSPKSFIFGQPCLYISLMSTNSEFLGHHNYNLISYIQKHNSTWT